MKGLLGKRELVKLLSPVTPSVCLLWFGGGYAIVEKALLFYVAPRLCYALFGERLAEERAGCRAFLCGFQCASFLVCS